MFDFDYYLKTNDIVAMEQLYKLLGDRNNVQYYYALMLIQNGKVDEGKEILHVLASAAFNNSAYNKAAKNELGKLYFREGNLNAAKEMFSKMDNEYHSRFMHAKLEYYSNNEEEAIEELRELLNKKLDIPARIILSIIYLKQGRYEESFDVINNVILRKPIMKDYLRSELILNLSKKLNIYFQGCNYDKLLKSYYTKQIINYNKQRALSHIIVRHLSDFNKDIIKDEKDLNKMFEASSLLINENTKTQYLRCADRHILEFPNIGVSGENKVQVVTLINTNEIITMFPRNYVDYNELDDTNEESLSLKQTKRIK